MLRSKALRRNVLVVVIFICHVSLLPVYVVVAERRKDFPVQHLLLSMRMRIMITKELIGIHTTMSAGLVVSPIFCHQTRAVLATTTITITAVIIIIIIIIAIITL